MPIARAILLVLLASSFARAQTALIDSRDGENATDNLGTATAPAGDADGDLVPDVFVSAPSWDAPGEPASSVGRIYLLSGSDLSTIRTMDGEVASAQLGSTLSGGMDLDGDGAADVVGGRTPVVGFSGSDGTELFSFDGGGLVNGSGLGLAALGDLDGDDMDDVAVGEPVFDIDPDDNRGRVILIRSDGSIIRTIDGPATHRIFGRALAGSSDHNGDDVPDYVVASRLLDGAVTDPGRVELRSGATDAVLWGADAEQETDNFGLALAAMSDVTDDGIPEVLVGAPDFTPDDDTTIGGKAYLLDGATGAEIFTWTATGERDQLGTALADVGDIDGDAVADIGVGAPNVLVPILNMTEPGFVEIFSGADGTTIDRIDGEEPRDLFGATISGLGTGPAGPIFAVGAPFHSGAAGSNTGRVYLYGLDDGAPCPANAAGIAAALATLVADGSSDSVGDLVSCLRALVGL